MSTLTEEQRKRIEENRRKALEKRALKAAVNNNVVQNQISVKPNFNANNSLPCNNTVVKVPNLLPVASVPPQVKTVVVQSVRGPVILPSFPSSTKSGLNSFKSFEVIKGKCILLSRKRFYVDIIYNKAVVEIFQSVPGRVYDLQTKTWNFSIDDHDKLIALLKPLQQNVLVVPLPKNLLRVFKEADEQKKIKEYDLSNMDPVLVEALLPFQKTGLYFGIQHGGRVLLADDMGLGKTIQGIAIANYFSKDWPLLVVTPSSVRYSWLESFSMWLPSVGSHEMGVINSSKDHIPDDKVVIMSYDLLTKMQTSIINRRFKSVIFDESHFLKNFKTARTKAAQAIMKNMVRVILLSGTPALSRPIELFTQLSALRPKYFNSYIEYGVRYCDGNQGTFGWDFSGSSNMSELQIVLEELVMIRRLKSEVITELPSKCRQMVLLDPSQVKKGKLLLAMSAKLQQKNLSKMERRGALLEYFHETGHAKIPAVCQYVDDLLESDKKFLCFAHHQNVLNSICQTILKKKIDYIRIDGSVSSENRKKLCDHFQLNDKCKVAVLSITSANCGITLTAASLVVFAELFWNPGILTQAEDRAHRIGQEDSVLVQYLVARNTADDEIWPIVQRKLDILNKAGLSKDNFNSADTIVKEDPNQLKLDELWNELELPDGVLNFDNNNVQETLPAELWSDLGLELPNNVESNLDDSVPEKRVKLEL